MIGGGTNCTFAFAELCIFGETAAVAHSPPAVSGRRQITGGHMLTAIYIWLACQIPLGILVGKFIKHGMQS